MRGAAGAVVIHFPLHLSVSALPDSRYTMRPGHLRHQILSRLAAGPRRLAHAIAPAWGARLIGGFSWLVLAEPADRPPA